MSEASCLSGVTDEGTMISNLPLLFADGYPTCLETISEEQLEKFVPFMVQCSSGHIMSNEIRVPKWWPEDLPFTIPLTRPPGMDVKWMAILKSLVCRCYTYHGCEFMLPFCTELAKYPKSRLRFTSDWVGTTSLYDKECDKLLVTFRDENRLYDKRKESPRKSLLPRVSPSLSPSKVRVSQLFPDIYLCDSCDAEFKTFEEVRDHEKICFNGLDVMKEIPIMQPEDTPEDLSTHQGMFLNYFHLQKIHTSSQLKEQPETSQYKRPVATSVRYAAIPFSSPLGILLNKKTKNPDTVFEAQLERVERYCLGTTDHLPSSRTRECRNLNDPWPITWKPSRKKDESDDYNWVHTFKFPCRQFRRRIILTGNKLTRKRRDPLKTLKNCQVWLRRLTKHEIEFYTSPYISQSRGSAVISSTFKESNIHNDDKSATARHPHKVQSTKETENMNNFHTLINGEDSNDMLSSQENPADVPIEVANPIDSITPPVETLPFTIPELVPNTLYSYDMNLMVTKSDNQANSDPDGITLIDLCSSDEECEAPETSQNYDVLNSVTDKPVENIIENVSSNVTHRSDVDPSLAVPVDDNGVLDSTFVGYRKDHPELYQIFTPHIVHYYHDNEPGAYVSSMSSKSTSNLQTKYVHVPVSMLEKQPVTNEIAANGDTKHYEDPEQNTRLSGLRTHNCDDISKGHHVTNGYLESEDKIDDTVKDKNTTFEEDSHHWTQEDMVSAYYILSHDKQKM